MNKTCDHVFFPKYIIGEKYPIGQECSICKHFNSNADLHISYELIRPSRPKIVCLCGSTRFHKDFVEQNYLETMKGNIILSVGFFMHSGEAHGEHIGITPEQKEALDELHKRKIDLADEILVINKDGYVGDSTRSEIEYAKKHGKNIRYVESLTEYRNQSITDYEYPENKFD